MKHIMPIMTALGLLITASHANTTVYKSTGKHGETVYSQFMPKGTTKYETLQMRSDGRTASAGNMASLPDPATAPAQSDESKRIAELEKQVQEQKAQEMTRHCQNMRSNLANLNTGGRIYETNAQGQRVYLNDQEISSKKQRITESLKQYCGG
ncbi:MAG: DUF4124 domain-containing protein [Moraxella sp.]|nr:DUF4124 domain-containing protein [Moraxella sp.]